MKIVNSIGRIAGSGRRFAILAAVVLGLGLMNQPQAAFASLLFDNISNYENGVTNAAVTSTGSTPNTFIGDGYNLATGAADITGFDLYPVNLTGTAYTGLQVTIYVWGTVNTGAVSAAAPAFSNLLATYTLQTDGDYQSGFFYNFESANPGVDPGISLTNPLALTGTRIGLTVNYQGTTDGVTYASANSLTSIISYGTAPTVGSNQFNGYYRNANSEVNGNFTSTLRSLGLTNQSFALRVYGDVRAVPEPGSWAILAAGLGLTALVVTRKRAGMVG